MGNTTMAFRNLLGEGVPGGDAKALPKAHFIGAETVEPTGCQGQSAGQRRGCWRCINRAGLLMNLP